MKTADFLFPTALEVTPTNLSNILLIGSCMARDYVELFKNVSPHTQCHYVLMNNAQELTDTPPFNPAEIDVSLIQIPIRTILTDAAANPLLAAKQQNLSELLDHARQRLEVFLDAALKYHRRFGILTAVSNFITPQRRLSPSISTEHSHLDLTSLIEALNDHLSSLVAESENLQILDSNAIASSIGKQYFFDDSIAFSTHGGFFFDDWSAQEHSPWWGPRLETIPPITDFYDHRLNEFAEAVFRSLVCAKRTALGTDTVKLVIFDLDNTLWRGLIGEHYHPEAEARPHADGWPIGLWDAIQHLRWRGILVALCSKNDPTIVEERWSLAVNPPFLSLDDFVIKKIGWQPKPDAIAEILEATSLTPKSVVFVDDNPTERAAAIAAFPALRVLGENPFLVRRTLLWSAETRRVTLTKESVNREVMIRNQIKRDVARKKLPRAEFLQSLNTHLRINFFRSTQHFAFARCLELLNKTNQFNTTGKRWTGAELATFLEEGGSIQYFSAKDRFVDYGIVGVLLLKPGLIVQMVMSCRVLGFEIENAAVRIACENPMHRTGKIAAQLIETPDNSPTRDLFARCGFERLSPTNFEISGTAHPPLPTHLTIETVHDDA